MRKNQKFLELMKGFQNPNWLGNQIGIVIKEPPELTIKVNETITAYPHQIYETEEKTQMYTRDFFQTGDIEIEIEEIEITDTENTDSGGNKHNKIKGTGKMTGSFQSSGENSWTDQLKIGDSVAMLHFPDQNLWLLVDKVTKYEEKEL